MCLEFKRVTKHQIQFDQKKILMFRNRIRRIALTANVMPIERERAGNMDYLIKIVLPLGAAQIKE